MLSSSSNSAVLVFEVVVSVLLVSLQVEHAAVQVLLAASNVRARLVLLMNLVKQTTVNKNEGNIICFVVGFICSMSIVFLL